MQTTDWWDGEFRKSVEQAMAILARDHPGEPRLGPNCLKLVAYPSPLQEPFPPDHRRASRPDRQGTKALALAVLGCWPFTWR
ncbi:MAG: hypothetical protein U0790_24110 [Isosphaeraceae bacterium]